MVRLRRDKYESHELFLTTVGDAVILSGRREHDFTGPELALLIPNREHALPFENVVDLVLPAMSVETLLLAWLETVGVAEKSVGFEHAVLFHLLGRKLPRL